MKDAGLDRKIYRHQVGDDIKGTMLRFKHESFEGQKTGKPERRFQNERDDRKKEFYKSEYNFCINHSIHWSGNDLLAVLK